MAPRSGAEHHANGCPVDHNNMSEAEIAEYMSKHHAVGAPEQKKRAGDSCPVDHANMTAEQIAKHAEMHGGAKHSKENEEKSASKCPVDHKNMSEEQVAGFMSQFKGEKISTMQKDPSDSSNREQPPSQKMYDVYGQEIDPANKMPTTPNQVPSPGQQTRLSTDREASSIPKSGGPDGETWVYPSPQMFYNALQRKGKAADVDEADMDTVVAIHNSMNEKTWNVVMDWERRFHCDTCPDPKLKRFTGRPHDLSPAAWFRSTFRGYAKPFDRHDWTVDRCGKEDVTYIIDYYYRENTADGEPIEIHVRPAIESMSTAWDRLRYGATHLQSALFGSATPSTNAPVSSPKAPVPVPKIGSSPEAPVDETEFNFLRSLTPDKIEQVGEQVQEKCGKFGHLLESCGDDPVACEQANVALNYCMATAICGPQSKEFMAAMEADSGAETAAYEKMTNCLQRFHIMARRVVMHAAGVVQKGPEK